MGLIYLIGEVTSVFWTSHITFLTSMY